VIRAHSIADADLTALAQGLGGPTVIRELWAGQHSKRLLMLRLLMELWPTSEPGRDEALATIGLAESEDPGTVRQILVDPMIGAWTAATVRQLRQKSDDVEVDLRHMGAVATVAALRTGISASQRVWVRSGRLHLPTLGRIRLPGAHGPVTLTTSGGELGIDDTTFDAGDYDGRRTLTADGRPLLTVALEDLDPYRDAYHVPAVERVPDMELSQWHGRLNAAWRILTTLAPERASEIAAGLHCLVPLTKPDARAAHSATSTEAVGVIGLDLQRRPEDFAVALVHEFQHSKLAALLDIEQLYEDSERRFFAPWRTDPRPIGGLFQGVYAFIGVADTWRALYADPVSFPQAQREFAEARANVTDAVATLAGSGLLTSKGQRFVHGMMDAIDRLQAVAVPPAIAAAAEMSLRQRRSARQQRSAQAG
jgi:HEXXH motif-containing protein